ncbi:MAG: methyltransferase domain-containing protein [Dehalococcoidales bacterium]|jgi:SAM-dependent methyltransferase
MNKLTKKRMQELLKNDKFPRSAKYDPEWVLSNNMGPNALWLTEWLCEKIELKPGMRVLDMGCGKAMSSVFLAKEYGVKVWANDLWISATENWLRIMEAGLENQICPIHAEAHALPYAEGFFDAIVSLDSYQYYGTDDLYLLYFHKFLKPGGQIGIVVPGLTQAIAGPVPEHLAKNRGSGKSSWSDDWWCFHTAEWWQRHWDKMSFMKDVEADLLPDGWRHWLQFERAALLTGKVSRTTDTEVIEADAGRYMALIRVLGRRKE